jgi:hypothetical protein
MEEDSLTLWTYLSKERESKFNKMKKFYFVFLFCIFLTTTILAQDVNQVGDWWGKVTINSVEDNGATIEAYIGGIKISSATVGEFAEKYYLIHIEGETGDQILFKVNGVDATTVDWSNGDHQLNLAITSTTTIPVQTSSSGGGSPGKSSKSSVSSLLLSAIDLLSNDNSNDNSNENENLDLDKKKSDELNEESSSTSFMNAAVVGVSDFVKSPKGKISVGIIILISAGAIFISVKKRNVKIPEEKSLESENSETETN